ncbi:MAG: alpha-L-glutamate ligase [Azospirillaceae bacterium]
MPSTPLIHVLHENDAWLPPLRARLAARGLAYTEWHLGGDWSLDLDATPPEGVFYNRMSASSHTRGHRFAPEITAGVLAWLEAHGREVVNGTRAIDIEISKARQYAALRAAGIATPRTLAATGRDAIAAAIARFDGPLVLKPNRGGKGLGVRRFDTQSQALAHLDSPDFDTGIDGITLVQDFVVASDGAVTRAEFVGGRLVYTVRIETGGAVELCPADVCQVPDQAGPVFTIVDDVEPDYIRRLEAFTRQAGLDVVGIEFVRDGSGTPFAYDVNTNTNYNALAEAADVRSGMDAIAAFLGERLQRAAKSRLRAA